jgi:hypothetical protein
MTKTRHSAGLIRVNYSTNNEIICDIVRYGATLCTMVRHGATLCDIVRHCAALCGIVRHCATMCDIVRKTHNVAPCRTMPHKEAFFCAGACTKTDKATKHKHHKRTLKSSMRFLGAADVLQRGFKVCQGLPSRNFDRQEEPTKNDIKLFKKHYGSDPAVLARLWHDMGETILLETGETIIPDSKDKTEKGFKYDCDVFHMGLPQEW